MSLISFGCWNISTCTGSDAAHTSQNMNHSALVKFFSKLNNLFLGYFDPINNFLIIKMNNFRGDLSDISAKTATPLCLYSTLLTLHNPTASALFGCVYVSMYSSIANGRQGATKAAKSRALKKQAVQPFKTFEVGTSFPAMKALPQA